MDLLLFAITIAAFSTTAGLIGSFTGLGGGVIITPLLVLGYGVNIHYAVGAALTSVIATSSGAAIAYLRKGISNVRIAIFLSIATTLGAVCGASLATIANTEVLSIVFGVALLLTALLSILKKDKPLPNPDTSSPLAVKLQLPDEYPEGGKQIRYGVFNVIPGFCVMIVAGLLSGLLGIGSGAFKVLGMDQIMKLPFRVTTATSNFMIGLTGAASIGIYLKHGFFDPILACPVALGVLIGAFVGGKLLNHLPIKPMRAVFLVLVFLIGLEMVLRGVGVHL